MEADNALLPLHRRLGILLVLLGVLSALAAGAAALFWPPDGNGAWALGALAAWGAGLVWLGRGLAHERWRLPARLERRPRAVMALSVALLGATSMEILLRSRYKPSRRELLIQQRQQSIHYLPSSFGRSRLIDSDWDVLNAEGRVKAQLRNGYRGPAFPRDKPQGETRVVVIGGSFVYDPNPVDGEDWPTVLQATLHQAGFDSLRVINAGVPGHASSDSIGRLWTEIHQFQPDYVLLCNAWNDIKYFNALDEGKSLLRAIHPTTGGTLREIDKRIAEQEQLIPSFLSLFQIYRFGEILRDRWQARVDVEGVVPEANSRAAIGGRGLEQYTLNLRVFAEICREIGAEPIFLIQPRLATRHNSEEEKRKIKYDYVNLDHEALLQAYEACESAMRRVGADKGVRVIDVTSSINGNLNAFSDHVHLKPAGSRLFGSKVAESLGVILR